MPNIKYTIQKSIQIIGWLVSLLFACIITCILVVRLPIMQQYLASKAVNWAAEKTNTDIRLDKIHITFRVDAALHGLYIGAQNGDTLAYFGEIEAGISMLSLIRGKIDITKINVSDANIAIGRNEEDSTFNFQFLLEAFTGDSTHSNTETTKSNTTTEITIGPVRLANVAFAYDDAYCNMYGKIQIGQLHIITKKLDFDNLHFDLDKINISNTTASWQVDEPNNSPIEADNPSIFPTIKLGAVKLNEVAFSFSIDDELALQTNISTFDLQNAYVNLHNYQVTLDAINLEGSTTSLALFENAPKDNAMTNQKFDWPQWSIDLKNVVLENNIFKYQHGMQAATHSLFNPNHLHLRLAAVKVDSFYYQPQHLKANFSFEALSDWGNPLLEKAQIEIKIDSGQQMHTQVALASKTSELVAYLHLQFENMDQLINDPLAIKGTLIAEKAQLDAIDLAYIAPKLLQNDYIKLLKNRPLKTSFIAHLDKGEASLTNPSVSWGQQTKIDLRGALTYELATGKYNVDLPKIEMAFGKSDLEQLFATELLYMPEDFKILGMLRGNNSAMSAEAKVLSSVGELSTSLGVEKMDSMPEFNSNISLKNINLRQLLGYEEADMGHGTLAIKGKGDSMETLTADINFTLDSLSLMGYTYRNLSSLISINERKISLNSNIDQNDIAFHLTSKFDLSGEIPFYNIDLDLHRANFQPLGLTEEDVRAQLNLDIDHRGDASTFENKLQITQAVFSRNDEIVRLKDIKVGAKSSLEHSALSISSGFLIGQATASISLTDLPLVFENIASRILNSSQDSIYDSNAVIKGEFSLFGSRYLREVLFPGLERLDTAKLLVDIDLGRNKLAVELVAPYTEYGTLSVNELGLSISGKIDSLIYDLSIGEIINGPVNISSTDFSGVLHSGNSYSTLAVADDEGHEVIFVAFQLGMTGDSTVLALGHQKLLLNYQPWHIPESNWIKWYAGQTAITDFALENNGQKIILSNPFDDDLQSVSLQFQNFGLSTFTAFLSAGEAPIDGEINGQVLMQTANDELRLTADVSIANLLLLGNELGNLNFTSANHTLNEYTLGMTINGLSNDLSMSGKYIIAENGNDYHFNVKVNRLDMALIEAFADEYISKTSGYLSGVFAIDHSHVNHSFEGYIDLTKVGFIANMLNAYFSVDGQRITVDNNRIYVKEFLLKDERGKQTLVNGGLSISSLLNPTFDVTVNSEDFLVLNSTKENNGLYFGKMFVDVNARLTGSASSPKIDLIAKLNKGSDLTYVVPESELEIIERDGIVMFFNAKDRGASDTTPQGNAPIGFEGFTLKSMLRVDPESKFKLVLDERSGDHISIEGTADLNFNMTPNGSMELTGSYTLSSGVYELSLYEIVQRKFEIVPGSKIIWEGNPYDASLDIQAVYKVRSRVSDLMADQLAGADEATRSSYRQELPFEVMILIGGEIAEPEISFRIEMPQNQRGALGGNVYSKINQLNSNEPELNKQVFSLIVFNQFIPAGLSGFEGGNSNLARSSVNQVLSNQLNSLSSKYIKGVELDFNLNSYLAASEQGTRETTQLTVSVRKALFDNRVVIQVGSQVGIEGARNQGSDLMGDFSLEYLMSESGRYRMRAFRKNIFEDIVEGQVILSGLSIMFNREFNSFDELFAPRKTSEAAK